MTSLPPSDVPLALFHLSRKGTHDQWDPSNIFGTMEPLLPGLKPRPITDLFYACRTLPANQSFWKALCTRGQTCTFDKAGIAGVLNVIAVKSEKKKAPYEIKLVRHLYSELLTRSTELDAKDIGSTLHAMVKLHIPDRAVVLKLCSQAKKLTRFTPQEIVQILSALAELREYDKELAMKLIEIAKLQASEYDVPRISRTLDSLAKLKVEDKEFVSVFITIAKSKIDEFDAQEIACTLNALRKFSVHDPEFVSMLVARAKKSEVTFNAQQVAVTLNSLSSCGVDDKDLLAKLVEVAKKRASAFNTQGLSNVLRAAGDFGVYDQELVTQLVGAAKKKILQFTIGDITNALSGLAKLAALAPKNINIVVVDKNDNKPTKNNNAKVFEKEFVKQLTGMTKTKAQDCGSKHIASILHALATLGVYDESLVILLVAIAKQKAQEFRPHDTASTLDALAKFKVFDQSLAKQLAEAAKTHLEEASVADVSTILTALAKFGINDDELVAAMAKLVMRT